MKFDKTNIDIIRELKQGKKSFKKIADKLAITEKTARSRANKLQEEGVLDVCGLIDTAKLPGHGVAIIGIKLSEMNLVEKGAEISKLKGVISTSVVAGRFDLIVLILFQKETGFLDFYTEQISQIEGVSSVETFVVYKSYNLKVPYIF